MKRSEINAAMKSALKLIKSTRLSLPPFLLWTPEEWKTKGEESAKLKIICLAGISRTLASVILKKTGSFLSRFATAIRRILRNTPRYTLKS